MDYGNYLKKMRDIQQKLLNYINNEEDTEETYQNIHHYFKDIKILEDPHIFKETISLIVCISNNIHRTPSFFSKIDRILSCFKDQISKNFSNYEIFTIFRKNYRIMFFLIKEQILNPDFSIFANLTSKTYRKAYYPHFFTPEFKPLFEEKDQFRQAIIHRIAGLPPTKESSEKKSKEFEIKRQTGENDEQVCQIIRSDSIEKFISYVKKVNLSLSSTIGSSIFETNHFLINKNPTLIQYAAFFGSIKIFNYLIENKIELDSSLWMYAIHSQNMELIHILENNKIMPEDETYQDSLFESIKCHHNEMTEYILNTFLKDKKIDQQKIISQSIRYNNYQFFPDEMAVSFDLFYELCKYDYYSFVEFFLKENINLNQTKVSNSICLDKVLNN